MGWGERKHTHSYDHFNLIVASLRFSSYYSPFLFLCSRLQTGCQGLSCDRELKAGILSDDTRGDMECKQCLMPYESFLSLHEEHITGVVSRLDNYVDLYCTFSIAVGHRDRLLLSPWFARSVETLRTASDVARWTMASPSEIHTCWSFCMHLFSILRDVMLTIYEVIDRPYLQGYAATKVQGCKPDLTLTTLRHIATCVTETKRPRRGIPTVWLLKSLLAHKPLFFEFHHTFQ